MVKKLNSYNPQGTASNKQEKEKADGWLNLTAIVNKAGTEFSLRSIASYGVPLYVEKHALSAALLERAALNGGEIEVTIKATVRVVDNEVVADFGDF